MNNMYNLIYFYIHKLVEKRNPDPKFYSAGVVAFSQWVHLGFIITCINKLFNISILPLFSDTYLFNKLIIMPFLIVWLIITHMYNKKKYPMLINKYSEKNIINIKNTAIVFSLLIVPLLSLIFLLKK